MHTQKYVFKKKETLTIDKKKTTKISLTIIARFYYNGKLKIRKVDPVKINWDFTINNTFYYLFSKKTFHYFTQTIFIVSSFFRQRLPAVPLFLMLCPYRKKIIY